MDATVHTSDAASEPLTTGDQAVDAALSALGGLAQRPVREHVGVFEAVHGALSDRLAETRE